jgi:hypothetical protein
MLSRVVTVLVLLLLIAISVLYFKVASLDVAMLNETGRVRTYEEMLKVQQGLVQRLSRLERSSSRIEARVKRLEVHRGSNAPIDQDEHSASLRAQTLEELRIAGVEAAVVRRVEQQLETRISEVVTRPRTHQGEWIAPLNELAQMLALSPEATERLTHVFNEAHQASFELLSKVREDGSTMLDDLVDDLRTLGPPRGFQRWLGRLDQSQVPGGEGTYAQAYGEIRVDVLSSLKTSLTDEQMRRFEVSKVAPLRVNTGYDPVRDYVEAALSP